VHAGKVVEVLAQPNGHCFLKVDHHGCGCRLHTGEGHELDGAQRPHREVEHYQTQHEKGDQTAHTGDQMAA